MPRHLWDEGVADQRCEVCGARRRWNAEHWRWEPVVSAICPGDEEDGSRPGSPGRNPPRSGRPVLEEA